MDQARLDCYSFGINCRYFNFFNYGALNDLTKQDDKGDASNRDNGSCPSRYLSGDSDLGRASCSVIGLSLSPIN
ncbi:hypothetical protein V6N12_031509 [Hibiscus sabdariffa]|uniref:Uncharacterized protein n=1 Tax=Hibiscus sabdariffa TaxID=183260 RepID=A0ABR2CQ45_9ROSI